MNSADFKSSFYAGKAFFNVGGNKRWIDMNVSTYNEICTLLNEARKVGAQDATKRLVIVVNEWAEK
ncbi:MAG TPA: hypothetical protein VF783_14010 [Terriglobales bacterium]